jgi:hypothetical protein
VISYHDEASIVISLNDDEAAELARSTLSYTFYSFSPDGRYVAFTSDGAIVLADSLEQRVYNFPVSLYISSIDFHPTLPIMAYTDSTGVYFLNLENPEAAAQILAVESISTVEFSESGTVLILRTNYSPILQFYQVVSE